MKKYLEINGEKFKIYRPKKYKVLIDDIKKMLRSEYVYSTIYDAYERPSDIKVAIWEDWMRWYKETANTLDPVYDICITSRNTFKFTIGALYFDFCDCEWYYLSITDCSQTATLLKWSEQ